MTDVTLEKNVARDGNGVLGKNVTLDKTCTPDTFPRGGTTTCAITMTNTDFSDATVSMTDPLPRELGLVPGSITGGAT